MIDQNDTLAIVSRMQAQLDAMAAENAKLKAELANAQARKSGNLSLSISPETGAICLYGIRKQPISLYEGEWAKVIAIIKDETLPKFIETNKDNPLLIKARENKLKRDAEKNAGKAQA